MGQRFRVSSVVLWVVAAAGFVVAGEPFQEVKDHFVRIPAEVSGLDEVTAARVRSFENPEVSQIDVWVGGRDPVSLIHTTGTARTMSCSAVYLSEERWLSVCGVYRDHLFASHRELMKALRRASGQTSTEYFFLGSGAVDCEPVRLTTGARKDAALVRSAEVQLQLLVELGGWSNEERSRLVDVLRVVGAWAPHLGDEVVGVLGVSSAAVVQLEKQPDAGNVPDWRLTTLDFNQHDGLGYWMEHVAGHLP